MAILFIILTVVAMSAFAHPNNKRIMGGAIAPIGAFPYMASLRDRSGSHFCGGSIISANTILTAKHCLRGESPSSVKVVVGSTTLDAGGITYSIKTLKKSYSGDIGLLILKTSIALKENITTIIDLETERNDEKRECLISGWGRTESTSSPNSLQFVVLKTLPNNECRRQMSIGAGEICTLTIEGEGTCYGDSGSPLVSNGKQIGVVSRGIPCAVGKPDVYARVSNYIEWIEENKA